MKKLLATTMILTLALAAAGCGVGVQQSPSEKEAPASEKASTEKDTKSQDESKEKTFNEADQKAISAALSAAGVAQNDVKGLHVKDEAENGKAVKEVKFYQPLKKYEYKVAEDGSIVDTYISNGHEATDINGASVTAKDALAKAFEATGEAKDDLVLLDGDADQGDQEYEFDIVGKKAIYEVTVDAKSGSIKQNKQSAL